MNKEFKLGDIVECSGTEARILGFTIEYDSCVLQLNKKSGHDGKSDRYWFDEDGKPINYIKGYNRYFAGLDDITKIKRQLNNYYFY